MKKILFEREKSTKRFTCDNGDVYADTMTLFGENPEVVLLHSEYANTIASKKYEGKCGRLAAGKYYGVVGNRWDTKTNDWTGKRVVKLFKHDPKVLDRVMKSGHTYLGDEDMELPSSQKNPNDTDGDAFDEIRYTQIHDGGTNWSWSQGCSTLLNSGVSHDYTLLMACLKDNEIVEVEIREAA